MGSWGLQFREKLPLADLFQRGQVTKISASPRSNVLRSKSCLEEATRKDHGNHSICVDSRYRAEMHVQISKSLLPAVCAKEKEGHKTCPPLSCENYSETLERSEEAEDSRTLSSSSGQGDHAHRRVSTGKRALENEVSSREVEHYISEVPYTHSGTGGCGLGHEGNESKTSYACPGLHRQYGSPVLHNEGRFTVNNSEFLDAQSNQVDAVEGDRSDGKTHSSRNECDSRRSVTVQAHASRMDVGPDGVPVNVLFRTQAGGGSVRDPRKVSDTSVRIPEQRPEGGGDGCLRNRLESVGSVSPVPPNFPPENITTFHRENILHGRSNMAQQAMVPITQGINSTVLSIEGLPHSEEWKKSCYRYLRSGERPTRLDFLSKIYERQFSKVSAQYLIKNLRTSSNRQYESIWSSWTQFIEVNNPPCIQSDTVMKFLIHLFENKRLATSTIVSYKCALKEPLLRGFGVDVCSSDFAALTRSFSLKRPSVPGSFPTWPLESVLDLVSSEDFTREPIHLLEKTLFLVALACGPRISELKAMRRGQHLNFVNGGARLCLDPTFLAKNEDPLNRRKPVMIRPLPTDTSLCPVAALKSFLEATPLQEGPLFVSPVNLAPLSTGAIRVALARVIRQAVPDSFPKSHDLRKLASSLAFMGNMSLSQMSSYTGWKSSSVFVKHYCGEVSLMQKSCIALGSEVGPSSYQL